MSDVRDLTTGPCLILAVTLGDLQFAVKAPMEDVALRPGVSTKLRELADALARHLEDKADPAPHDGDHEAVQAWADRRVELMRARTGIQPLAEAMPA